VCSSDLTITVDPHRERIVRWFGDPTLSEAALAEDDYFSRQDMDPRFRENQLSHNQELLDLFNEHGHKLRMAVASSASRAVVARAQESGMGIYWWNPFYDDYDAPDSITKQLYKTNRLPCLNAGGNVGAAGWVICHAILNKSRIALLGMDFAYYAETPYRETQYFHELCELVGEANLDQVLVHMNNPHLEREFYTDPAYLWYRESFLEMARLARAEGVTTYNCTGGGILFGDGVEFESFDSFIRGSNRGEEWRPTGARSSESHTKVPPTSKTRDAKSYFDDVAGAYDAFFQDQPGAPVYPLGVRRLEMALGYIQDEIGFAGSIDRKSVV